MITEVNTLREAKPLYSESKNLFAAALMNLREWTSNLNELMKFIPNQDKASASEYKLLGINWNLISDK